MNFVYHNCFILQAVRNKLKRKGTNSNDILESDRKLRARTQKEQPKQMDRYKYFLTN